jgi:8-oxo-dGTP pyrophosphatase MutT (NUDIX family)
MQKTASGTAHPFSEKLRARLASRAPVRKPGASLTQASVLVALFARNPHEDVFVWLVRRSDGLRVHGGQVALPGGKKDAEDQTLLATALREAKEEIGLDPRLVDVLGALDDHVSGTGFVISPYVGWIAGPFEPEPLLSEVALAFAVPLAIFRGEPSSVEVRDGHGARRTVISYKIGDETVWGITAAILRDLVGLFP